MKFVFIVLCLKASMKYQGICQKFVKLVTFTKLIVIVVKYMG